jgi:hypothetical protein
MDAFRPIRSWITPPSSGNALVDQLGRICIDKSAYVDRFERTLDNEHPEVCEAGLYM